jgi:hypothetical protein
VKIDIEKLEELFRERYSTIKVAGDPGATYDQWLNYCDGYKILILHPDWLVETINEGLKGMVCIHSPECKGDMPGEPSPWLLVPRKFAERCLVLGGLPGKIEV